MVPTPAPSPYRPGLADYARDGAAYYARLLEETIQREGPRRATSSAWGEICRRHGILTLADEVMWGCGRTGRFFASARYGFSPRARQGYQL
ncbi:aminotransferase class III-fold pyridoxal phosphate-dependent enzyme [Stigmatella erecta]|uniref:Uncharacterized protein n=1 Tax=Stigmatella erecta TaxID=83460 RepID=A0A1I0HRG5_9BACT|nr:aminotransferase class III-fold pyridoxal phosphate-dependent enzyme [Stigmatella erecta]SET85765.1 hypothetical protein SAMN05443639_10535 [Stigmatella erecta]